VPLVETGVRALLAAAALAAAAGAQPLPLPTTHDDFRLPGTQPNTVTHVFKTPDQCTNCHSAYGDAAVEPFRNWQGSMMAQSGRDPLNWAAVSVANQDAAGSGETCLRCHLPKGWLEGRSAATDGTLMTADDRHGVQCSVCHRLVDPFGSLGAPPEDGAILDGLTEPVPTLSNAMMVADPLDRRRGPFDVVADIGSDPHLPDSETLVSPFHRSSELCGTCHNVRNPVFTKNDVTGRFEPNANGEPIEDITKGFPEQTTYDEWAASEYASTGVYAPQFGRNQPVVSTCQDCHMPRVTGRDAAAPAILRTDLPLHDMTGANTFVPKIIPHHPVFGAEVDAEILDEGVLRATDMLRRAATLTLSLADGELAVRVTNESGHKLPTGYPEGRRMWLEVRAFDAKRRVVFESGRYVFETATLVDDPSPHVWEASQGIDEEFAEAIGLPAGKSFHLVLNNVVLHDNRIPPRGFTNAAFAAFDAGPVGASYADGQHWDDVTYAVGADAAGAAVTLWYQTASREYVEFLRDEDRTTANGALLHDLWEQHGKSEPVAMARGYVEEKAKFAENCRKSVANAQKRYRKAHEKEWSRCFETEGDGGTCDAAARDAKLADAEATLRAALGGPDDGKCAGANRTPSSLGHGTSCPVPCASITLYDMTDLADCTLCLAEALDGAQLDAAWGVAPPASPDTTPASAAECQAHLAKAASGLAAGATSALAKCESANASGKKPPVDCSQDPGLAKSIEKARKEIARCDSFAGVDGCAEAGDVDGTLACLEDALAEPATGYVGAVWP
jgi:Cytochrome c554 and c-prime